MAKSLQESGSYPKYRPEGRVYSPLRIPIKRRLDTLALFLHSSSIVMLPCLYFYLWTKESLWPLLIIYTIYSFILDDTQTRGNSIYRTSNWFRSLSLFKNLIDYFPVYTHRSVPLPATIKEVTGNFISYPAWSLFLPSRIFKLFCFLNIISRKERFITKEEKIGPRYMFTCHPHGVIAFGPTVSLCWSGKDRMWDSGVTETSILEPLDNNTLKEPPAPITHVLKSSTSFTSLFPGINVHLLTIKTQFLLAFYRDYIMALGVGLVTKSGIKSILKRNHSVAIVVGGAHESLFAKPGMNRIILNKRKGFIKLALESCNKTETDIENISRNEMEENIKKGYWNEHMSDIAVVPVYVYGENSLHNVYNTTEESHNDSSKLMKALLGAQLFLKKYIGFTIPIVNSRGIFNYDFGLLVYKRRLDLVTGEPIYIYRKFNNKVGDEVTEEEINYYHELYKTKLIELWKKNRAFGTEYDEYLSIVE